MANPERRKHSQPIPTADADTARGATNKAVWRLTARYLALAVFLNLLAATGIVLFDIYNDQEKVGEG